MTVWSILIFWCLRKSFYILKNWVIGRVDSTGCKLISFSSQLKKAIKSKAWSIFRWILYCFWIVVSNLFPRVLPYLSLRSERVGERTWERGCVIFWFWLSCKTGWRKEVANTLFDLCRVSCEKGFLFSEGRTGLFSPMRDNLFLFFLNPEFYKLFFVFRDEMVVRAPRKTWIIKLSIFVILLHILAPNFQFRDLRKISNYYESIEWQCWVL